MNLRGHDGQVTGIHWSKDDQRLVSCAEDGSVYEWDVSTGRRVNETVIKTCSYTDVAISPGTNQASYILTVRCILRCYFEKLYYV